MKNISNIRILVLILIITSFISGCQHEQKTALNAEADNSKTVNTTPVVLTDSTELEKLWQGYLYDAIYTVCNSQSFKSASEIEPRYLAEFCYVKYIAEHGEGSLGKASKDGALNAFPLSLALEYAKRYFELTTIDVSQIPEEYYDKEKKFFIFSIGREPAIPSYTEKNAFGIGLDKVIKNNDGTLNVFMNRYDSYATMRTEQIISCTLKQREDKSLYFVSGKKEFVNNNLVKLTGSYSRFDKIGGFEGNLSYEYIKLIGESDGKLILAAGAGDGSDKKTNKSFMLLVNPDTLSVEKQVNIEENFTSSDVKLSGDKVMIRLKDKIITMSRELEGYTEIPLPKKIIELNTRKQKFDKLGNPDVIFCGYDVSRDLTMFVYADETGVKLLNTKNNSEKLLSETQKVKDELTNNRSYHWMPRFIADDKKVITTMTCYEGYLGYTICDVDNGGIARIEMPSEAVKDIFFDTGIISVSNSVEENSEQKATPQLLYLDFKSGIVKEKNIQSSDEFISFMGNSQLYTGQKYAAYISSKFDENDNAKSISYVNRIDLETLKVEEKILSAKDAGIGIMGVLDDGRTVFWYDHNPGESDICITK